jgi:hypothetical protein
VRGCSPDSPFIIKMTDINFKGLKENTTIRELNRIEKDLRKEQFRRVRLNLCVECGINPQLEKGAYIIYPTCCRDCAKKLWELDKVKEKGLNNNRQVRELNKIPFAERLIKDL